MARNLQLQVVLDAVDRATGPLRRIMDGSRGTAGAIRQTRDNLRDLQDQQKRITAFRDMQRQSVASRDALRDKREALDRLNGEIAASENPSRRLLQQQERAQREVQQLSDQYQNQRSRVRELARELPQGAEGTRGLTEQQSALERQIRETNERLAAQQNALRRLGDADVGGKFRNMTGEVRRFARNITVAGGLAAGTVFGLASSTAALGDDVAKTADLMGIGTTQLQELRYAGERAGVSTSALDSSMQRMVRRIGRAAQGGGAAAKAYEELGINARELADMDPGQALGAVADRLNQIDNQTDRIAYASAIWGNNGEAMLNMIRGGSAELENYYDQARAIGFALDEGAVRAAEDFQDALLDNQLTMSGMRHTIGAELMPAVTDLIRLFTEWLGENRERVREFARDLGEGLKAAVPIVKEIVAGVWSLVRAVGVSIDRVATLVGGYDNLAIILGALVASKALFAIVAFVVSLVKAGAALVAIAKTLPAVVAGVKLLGAAFAATPIGWVVAGIAAVAALAFTLWKNWDAVGPLFKGWWEDLKALPGQAWDSIRDATSEGLSGVTRLLLDWSPLGILWRAITSALEQLGIDVPEQFKSLGGWIVDGLIGGLDEKWQALKERITDMGGAVVGWFKDRLGINSPSKVFEGFGTNIVEGIINGIAGMAGALRDHVMGMASNIASWMSDAVGNAWESGKEIAAGIGAGIAEGARATGRAVREAGGAALETGRDVARGMGDGIRNGATSAWRSIKDLATGTEHVARDELDTHSPSRVFRDIGSDVTAGLSDGISNNDAEPLRQVSDMARRLRNAVAGLLLGAAAIAGPAAAMPELPALAVERPEAATQRLELPELPALAVEQRDKVATRLDTRSPVAPAAPSITVQGDTIEIHVHAGPGMNEHDLAQQVARILDERERHKAARLRSAFHDID